MLNAAAGLAVRDGWGDDLAGALRLGLERTARAIDSGRAAAALVVLAGRSDSWYYGLDYIPGTVSAKCYMAHRSTREAEAARTLRPIVKAFEIVNDASGSFALTDLTRTKFGEVQVAIFDFSPWSS